MSNYHDYDDLFASYERRSVAKKTDEAAKTTERPKSSGYTSSSSYSKTKDTVSHGIESAKNKAGGFAKSVKDKIPKNKRKKSVRN